VPTGLFADDWTLACATRRRADGAARGVWPFTITTASGKSTHRNGDRYMGFDYRGRLHEIFCAGESNWRCILTIRTGSADFSRELVTRLRAHGHRQYDGHLHRVTGNCQGRFATHFDDDDTWGNQIPCPDEATYFAAAGLDVADWPPEKREAPR
jgi:hypothetical protein